MTDRLNVLLVLIEGARTDHLSVFGAKRRTTPFLEEIAAAGVRFPNMITVAPSTVSAHASLFTGLFASAHGTHDEQPELRPEPASLPEILRAAGYRTAAFCTSRAVGPEAGFGRGFDSFSTQRYQNRIANRAVDYGRRAGDRLLRRSDAGGRRTNEALREWLASGVGPFFAFVHYDEPRLPLRTNLAPEPGSPPLDTAALRLRAAAQDVEAHLAGKVTIDDAERTALNSLYDMSLHYVDARIAEVAATLRERGEWERTLVVVTADHGQSFGEHGVFGDSAGMHDSLLRVPLLLRCPGYIPQGFVVEETAQTVDIAPSILAATGLPVPEEMQGRVLFSAERATSGPEFAVAERFRPDLSALRRRYPDVDTTPWDVRMKMLRSRKEKFVWRSDEGNELYDLSSDPGEGLNLIGSEVARGDLLRRRLFDWFAAYGGGAASAPDALRATAGRGA